jgi:hypothetical protein
MASSLELILFGIVIAASPVLITHVALAVGISASTAVIIGKGVAIIALVGTIVMI